ncbi:HEAT repeat domain-containing protein [Methanosarcina sp. 1.H.A.2.2]|uniref:HEAT repeat domain-containing protein n=1 Tax=Methanosarcina sp. 1.H.A.2.2 TaxID=1483601 RepID=UPI0006221FE2|nr:HEAT repeat domain-containing protein [Methanosarcina sp. 1.H.A.2.2]KKH48727.1 hypothetical protein EO93_14655 [Methanosarcina sp. 1.H.A.2.2]
MIDQEEFHRKVCSGDFQEFDGLLYQINSNLSLFPDKQQLWDDLINLAIKGLPNVRWNTIFNLGFVFPHVPDKQNSWEDLIIFLLDEDLLMRWSASFALGLSFQYIPDKKRAWEILHELSSDKEQFVREGAAFTFVSAFQHIPDKEAAWEDIKRLIHDKHIEAKKYATLALAPVLLYISDEQIFTELYKLVDDESGPVRGNAAHVLGFVLTHILEIPCVPNKQEIWDALDKLAQDRDEKVKTEVVSSLKNLYHTVSDRKQVRDNLVSLTNDESNEVKMNAYYSLGKISIFEASQAETEEVYKKEFENAILLFEEAAKSSTSLNPAQFCYPFYRSLHTIIFKEQKEINKELEMYLEQAKSAVKDSKNKKLLFETVQNLANALKEVQNLEKMDIEAMKGELNFYRKYCEQAAKLMTETEEISPYATEVMRKGLPILDRKLKSLLEEIQEKAKTACQEAKGTDTEEIACAVSREVQKWEIGSQEEMTWNVENLIFALESSVPRVPANQHIFDRIQQIREQKDIPKQYGMVSTLIPLIPNLCMEQKIDSMEKKLDDIIVHFSESHTDLTISLGADFYGNGMKVTKTIPLHKFSDNEKGEMEGKIQGNEGIKLSSLPATLVKKIKDHLF